MALGVDEIAMSPLIQGRIPIPAKHRNNQAQYIHEKDLGPSPWRSLMQSSAPVIRIRVAETAEDAMHIKDVLHGAWLVQAGEPYFYGLFNEPEDLFYTLIKPSTHTDDIHSLDGLCFVAETPEKEIVGTLSLVFDHDELTVEIGRIAILPGFQGNNILQHFAEPVRQVFALLSDYSIISDTTTLNRSAAQFVNIFGAVAVSLHPSSFTVSPGGLAPWLEYLTGKYGFEIAHALLTPSPKTGLGRFATSYHLSLPTGYPVFTPFLSELQRPFFEYSVEHLGVCVEEKKQPVYSGTGKCVDHVLNACRYIVDPEKESDFETTKQEGYKNNIETILYQVPCDRKYQAVSLQLEETGALLCGVYPNTYGRWYASYCIFTSKGHAEKVLDNLSVIDQNNILVQPCDELLKIVLATSKKSKVIQS